MSRSPEPETPRVAASAAGTGERRGELSAEVIVRLGETVLEVRDLHAANERGLLSQTLRLSGAGLLGLSLVLGLLTPAVSVALLCAIAGAALIAWGLTTRPAIRDRFSVGEAPSADLPLSVRETPEDPPAASIELVRVIEGTIALRLPADLDGTIRGPETSDEALQIAALRDRGWRSHRLELGARAFFRRGPLTIEVGSIHRPSPLPAAPQERALDRWVLFSQGGSLALLTLLFAVASTLEVDLAAPPEVDELSPRLLRAITALPAPVREEAEPVRERTPSPPKTPQRSRRPAASPSPADVEATAPEEPGAMVEVDGETVAAPKIARSFSKRQRRRGGEKRLEDFADGDPGAAILGDMIERRVIVERESMAHYVDTREDFDAWAALTQGPPIQRGVGGLDLIGKGRTGGGEAEEIDTGLGSKAQAIQVAARPKAQPQGKLRVGAPKTKGGLSRAHLSEVARDGRSKLRRCWVDAERRGSDGGAVTLVVEIGGDGRVRDAQIKGPLDDPKLAPCLRDVAMRWRYERRGDDGTTVSYPLDYGHT